MRRQRIELERNKLLRRAKSISSDANMKQESNNIPFQTSQLKELPIKFKCPDESELEGMLSWFLFVVTFEKLNLLKN